MNPVVRHFPFAASEAAILPNRFQGRAGTPIETARLFSLATSVSGLLQSCYPRVNSFFSILCFFLRKRGLQAGKTGETTQPAYNSLAVMSAGYDVGRGAKRAVPERPPTGHTCAAATSESMSIQSPPTATVCVKASVQTLASRAALGDENALNQVGQRLRGPLASLIQRHTGADPDTTEDLVQQALQETLEALRSGRYEGAKARFITFAYGVTHKIILRYLRHRGRDVESLFSDMGSLQAISVHCRLSDDPDACATLAEIEAVRDCLSVEGKLYSLSPEERFVVFGRALGKRFELLSREMGRSLGTLHRRMICGLKKLHSCMASKGYR